jgi:hypothetical protein
MKTVLAFAAGLLLTLSTMAADRNPTVIIKSKRDYMIVVDGRTFHNDNTIRLDMRRGMHTIKVYERSRGLFGRTRLVSSKNFFVRNNDLRITVGFNGFVNIDERGYDRRDRDWDRDDRGYRNDRGYDNDRDWDRNDRGYDKDRKF